VNTKQAITTAIINLIFMASLFKNYAANVSGNKKQKED
jgi:hypothetical protein